MTKEEQQELELCRQVFEELSDILDEDFLAYDDHIQHIIDSHSEDIIDNYKYLGKMLSKISDSVQKYHNFILKKNGIE